MRLSFLLALVPAAALALPQNQFYWPSSNTGVSVCAYFDHAGQDWAGGSNRYSGHRGTDIALGVGNDVLAAAPGTVVARVDGCPVGYLGSTCGGGFGNHVALHHQGDTTFYAHMSAGSGIAGNGAGVACGERLGGTGNSGSSTGPHLHFEVRVGSSPGAPYSGSADDPYSGPVGGAISYWVAQGGGYSSACGVGTASPAPAIGCDNRAPRGNLDGANCDGISGWAQDENAPAQPIAAHLYFDGPAGVGTGVALTAGLSRADLCGPLGSCEHGFFLPAPRSLMDGQPHAVHGYAIDTAGGANPELGGSPLTLTCAQLPPAGTRRHIASEEDFTAWGFSLFQDVQTLTNAQLNDYAQAEDFPSTPRLIRADGTLEVYLLDRGLRRHVPSPAAAAAWHLDPDSATLVSVAERDLLQLGPPLRARPELVKGSGGAIYVIDAPLPPPSTLVGGAAPEASLRERAELPAPFRISAIVPSPPLGTGQPGARPTLPPPPADTTIVGGCSAAPAGPLWLLALGLALRRTSRRD